MNVPTHFSGQQSVQQVPGSSQLMANSLSSQMQNLGTYTNKMDTELLVKRKRTQEYIIQLLQRRNYNPNSELMQRIPEIAKRLEEHIFKDTLLQGQDYSSMSSSAIDLHLQGITKALCSSQQVHYIPSASVSTMIPTPGRTNYGNKGLTASQDNTLISSSTGGLIMQTAANTVNLSNSNGPVGMGQIASFTAPTGTIPNEYQQPLVNVIQNSGGTGIISSMGMVRQSSQMIPTPGLNNQQSLSTKPDSSIGGGFSSMNSPVTSQQQQKQYDGSQNNRLLHGLGMGGGLRSNIQQKSSPFNFHNVVMGGGMGGLVGSSMHHINGTAIPNGYLGPVSYAVSSKPLQQHLYKQQHQSLATASMPQKMVPLACDGYTMNTSDVLGSGNMYGCSSTSASTLNNQNSNSSMASKSNTNHLILTQTSLPSVQLDPQLKHQLSDTPQSMNFQSIHSTREQVQSHHQMQNCQHQQFQPSNQPCIQLIPSQRYENNKQQQQIISISDNLRQYSMESISEPLLSQDNEQFHFSELQNQFDDKTSIENLSQGAQALAQIQCPHLSQGAQALAQIQCPMNNLDLSSQISQKVWEAEQTKEESQNELSCLFVRSQTDAVSKKHWFSQSPQISCVKERLSFDQDMKEEENGAAVEAMPGAHAFVGHAIVPVSSNKMLHVSSREQAYLKQRRWLLLLLHSRKCPSPEGQCKEVNCITVQQLWTHIDVCNLKNCIFPRCYQSKKLLNHHWSCKVADCPVCIPVKEFITFFKVRCRKLSDTALASKTSNSWKNIRSPGDKVMTKSGSSHFEISDCIQPLTKRMKFQNSSLLPKVEASSISVLSAKQVNTPIDVAFPCKSEIGEVKMDTSLVDVWSPVTNPKLDSMSNTVLSTKSAMESCSAKAAEVLITKEIKPNDYKICEAKMQVSQDANIPPSDSATTASKSGKPKINGVSLIELFTVEQVRNHIIGLRQWIGQSKAKVEKNQALERSMTENSCQLCAVEKLTFEPPPIYCTLCGSRIKRNAMYYTVGTGDTRHYFCIPCYNEARCDTIEAEGSTFPKSRLEKKKNDEETEEWWVQCDKCEAWQHQICALFNGRRNDGGEAEYTCPNCYMEEVERGERKPLPQSTVLGAKDLPRTILSDHIEHRLFRRLKHERQERARHFGKSIDEVPGAEALVVRVVSSVDKKLDVKQRFLEIFQEENYPTEYLYKSKVILLFQKIEGVEVCLFGMYVQEFGSDCQFPNQRHVYLSYLDSVKYFRPEIRTVTGEALRTFVYHEILIGYLDYCKKRGFTSCYIWACPPLKGEDYILYCHPEIQKTPKSDKLREWYLSMLRKAVKENIVVGLTNLFDHFFVSNGESKAKVTAVRLPYFDGDYWPGAAEEMISQLRQDDDRKQQKKGKIKLTLTKRALKAAGHTDLGCNASKDAILMQKLGETISPMKDDFIMVHLQHACTHCCNLMVSGNRWVCHLCKHFQICDMCYEAEQKLDDRGRHPSNSRERHDLFPIEITGVLDDTKDKDEIIESEFFDTRQAFLSLCQGNHYQYDTLRRAKHSSMMVLYHLHNPTAPAFVTTCNVCYHDIETGQGWRCEVCPDFDVCNACYQKEGGIDHPHKLTNHPTNADCEAQSQEARKKRVLQLRSMLDLLVHASLCRSPYCQYPNCRKVKGLFRHGLQCKIRLPGGCLLCKRMWYLLQLHSRDCKESECTVPRCRDLKEHLKRLQQQAESRRRAAVMEMMRQRAAELQGTDN